MGQTYSVQLKLEFKDKKKARKALRKKIGRASAERVQYSLDHYKAIGIGTRKLHDLLRIFFGGWEGKLRGSPSGALESGFDASYGWESIMMDAFDEMAPFLKDNSSLCIYPDSGRDCGTVVNGKVQWAYT